MGISRRGLMGGAAAGAGTHYAISGDFPAYFG